MSKVRKTKGMELTEVKWETITTTQRDQRAKASDTIDREHIEENHLSNSENEVNDLRDIDDLSDDDSDASESNYFTKTI
ncbi:hypothetical protein AVEN_210473-1 [Araneus ventricosus]|uniref:Uncharacterized protein n=2 Tax=Araneus ventricosus TaxID=182803 RepID=A0A4Y2HV85_ARAVE|nr:hypothetical protein AVEN_64454-1 [Araneus ventricosus]GBM68922.1 hypothetical protein AVEN_91032-1 [Araneus ventricosus]GBM68949.1 hypothetical protein AVEN_210473-1 [Araneus ventricosus]